MFFMEPDDEKDTDLDLEEIASEDADLEIDEAPYEIRTQGADFTLELLSQKISSGEVIIPKFQRKYVWPVKKASRLIESYLLGLPVPQIFLYQESKRRDLLVVDGQQRLLSSHFFLRGTLEDEKTPFLLTNVKQQWEGKSFKDLEEGDKRRLKNYILRATIFEQIDPADDKSVYEIFERLNTGGMPLTEQEVRNCVTRGNINEFLDELNLDASWRLLLGKAEPDKRMKDVEMILRVFALIEGWDTYKKPMKDFISTYMAKNAEINEKDQKRLREHFSAITNKILTDAGPSALRVATGRINIAVLDSVMVAVGILGPGEINDLKTKLTKLKENVTYSNYVFQATTNEDSVKGRIKMCLEAFK
jgi:hypothetical protein